MVRPVELNIVGRYGAGPAFAHARRDLQNTQRGFAMINNDIVRGQRLLGTFAAGIGAGFAIGTLDALPRAIRETVAEAAGLDDLAAKIGLNVEKLQELHYQAEQNGSSAQQLDAALEQFSRRVGLAVAGQGELLDILKANGIALHDQAGELRPLDALLADYADLIKKAGNEQDRAVLATEAFGRAGDDMANVLAGGSAEMATMAQRAREVGVVLSGEAVVGLAEFDDRLEELASRWDNFWSRAALIALQALELVGKAEHALIEEVSGGAAPEAIEQAAQLREEIAATEAQLADFQERMNEPGGAQFALDVENATTKLSHLRAELEALGGEFSTLSDATSRALESAKEWEMRPGPGGGEMKRLRARLEQTRARAGPFGSPADEETIVPPRPGGGGLSDEEKAEREIKRVIQALRFEQDQLARTNVEQEVYNQLRAASVTLNSDAGKEIANLVRENAALEEQMRRVEEAEEQAAEMQRFFVDMGVQGLGSLIADGEEAEAIILRLGMAFAEAAALAAFFGEGPLSGLFGMLGNFGGFGGGAGKAALKGLGGKGALKFAGGFAEGGTIPSGSFGIVGEAGAELIRGPASVTPLTAPVVNFAPVTNIDARGSTMTREEIARILDERDRQWEDALPGMIGLQVQRGGIR